MFSLFFVFEVLLTIKALLGNYIKFMSSFNDSHNLYYSFLLTSMGTGIFSPEKIRRKSIVCKRISLALFKNLKYN
jgi:hypothetical protein